MAAAHASMLLLLLALFCCGSPVAAAANATTTTTKAPAPKPVYRYLPKPGTPEAKALMASKSITGAR